MRNHFVTVLALSLALSQFGVAAASAQTAGAPQAHFRTATAHTFSTTDLERYGLSSADAQQVAALQQQGYRVQVMSRAEAERITGGDMSSNTWLAVGAIALVVIAITGIVAVND